jgi:DNA-binding transcriptional LysR family regulator
MIDVRKLGMLAALDRLGTVAAVAEELRLTAPGVSMQLSAFEREIGVSLTERRGRRLALTPAGKLLAAHGRDVVDRLSLAEVDLHAVRQGAIGNYRIAAFPSAARTFVADAWAALRGDVDGLHLSLTTPEPEDALAALLSGKADLAVVHSYSNVPRSIPAGVRADPVGSEPVWIAIRSDDPAAAQSTIDLSDLAEHFWVTATRDLTCFEMTERACGRAGFRPRIVAETMDFAVQLELVAAGVGVALIPQLAIATVPRGVVLAPPTEHLSRHIHTAHRTSMSADPGVATITDAITAAAATRVEQPAFAPLH